MARIPRWKIVLGIVAVLVIVVGGFTLWAWSTAERRWEAMKAQALLILQEEQSRPAARPVLRGTAVPGNAWQDYSVAIGGVNGLSSSNTVALDATSPLVRTPTRPWPNRRERESILLQGAPAIARLQDGARKAEFRIRVRDENGKYQDGFEPVPVFRLAYLAAMKARSLADEGRPRDAAELLLDLGQFGRDLSVTTPRGAAYTWGFCVNMCLEGLRPLILSNLLPPDDLLEVERELEVLDRSLRRKLLFERTDLMEFALECIEVEDLYEYIRFPWPKEDQLKSWSAWRYLFSDRLMVADAFDEGMDHARRCEALRDAPWAELEKLDGFLDRKLDESSNPVVRTHLRQAMFWGPNSEMHLSRLRLLRIAAHYRATGEFIELEDPFGGTLRRAEDGCRWKLWTRGPDGLDSGGTGDWKGELAPLKDIVLEMDR